MDWRTVAARAVRSLGWIALALVAIVLAGLSGAFVLDHVPAQWQSHVALAGSLLILFIAIAVAVLRRSRRDPGVIGATKKVASSFSGGLLLFIGAWALLVLVLLLVLRP
jgi:hypothetical protein